MLLYTLGDSFTYGEELPNPTTQSWSAVLADKLGYDLINRGKAGCGNSYIVKTAMKQVPKLKPDLVLVAWTTCARIEVADEYGVYDISPGWNRRFSKSYPHRNTLMKYITSYHNELHQYRGWLRSVALLQDFFKLRNVNYKFINTFDNHELNKKYSEISQEYVDLIDTDQFIGWPNHSMMEWMGDCEKGPKGHPLELGHRRIADAIFTSLKQDDC